MVKDVGSLGVAMVAVDTFPNVPGINALRIDDRRGGALAAAHLLDLGHEKLAMVLPKRAPPSVVSRLAGFRSEFERRGRKFTRAANVVETTALTFEAAFEATRRVLSQKGEHSALFCANDEMAAGALRAVHASGRTVPAELSVVGFDGIVMGNYVDPPLTTVAVDKEHMGRRAMARLIELIEKPAQRPTVELAPVEMIVRGSSGKARGRKGKR
jgi:LacI family transcriptional regulator